MLSFPSIDHAILRGILGRVIGDQGVMWLIDRILQSGVGVLSPICELNPHDAQDYVSLLALFTPEKRGIFIARG